MAEEINIFIKMGAGAVELYFICIHGKLYVVLQIQRESNEQVSTTYLLERIRYILIMLQLLFLLYKLLLRFLDNQILDP